MRSRTSRKHTVADYMANKLPPLSGHGWNPEARAIQSICQMAGLNLKIIWLHRNGPHLIRSNVRASIPNRLPPRGLGRHPPRGLERHPCLPCLRLDSSFALRHASSIGENRFSDLAPTIIHTDNWLAAMHLDSHKNLFYKLFFAGRPPSISPTEIRCAYMGRGHLQTQKCQVRLAALFVVDT